ncbi:uncharacterized protein LOC118421132 [Branchiostoma floridae]|uniref:Uncharacterized protein LOC118421132 n=1 Tax=Branchiostoma floridae TaxID=7739 RepID=A0A9J7MZ50_BRAFL|nr:uncharacterized protein LOC118421132 [Branchiostoma floridae]
MDTTKQLRTTRHPDWSRTTAGIRTAVPEHGATPRIPEPDGSTVTYRFVLGARTSVADRTTPALLMPTVLLNVTLAAISPAAPRRAGAETLYSTVTVRTVSTTGTQTKGVLSVRRANTGARTGGASRNRCGVTAFTATVQTPKTKRTVATLVSLCMNHFIKRGKYWIAKLDYTERDGTYYKVVMKPTMAYRDAQQACAVDGGHLADVKTQELQDFLRLMVQLSFPAKNFADLNIHEFQDLLMFLDIERFLGESCWIGLHFAGDNDTWSWSDGTPLSDCTFTNWAPGKPLNNGTSCGQLLWEEDNAWNDLPCDIPKCFICQIGPGEENACASDDDVDL